MRGLIPLLLLVCAPVALADEPPGRRQGTPREAQAPEPPKEEEARAAGREQVDRETGEMVKTYQFGEFDISGRLKTPQLLYFLNRVRAEFERSNLDDRSFMQELVDSGRDPSL